MKAWRRSSSIGAQAQACPFPASALLLSNEDGDGFITWFSVNGDPPGGWTVTWESFEDPDWVLYDQDILAGVARQDTKLGLAGTFRVVITAVGSPQACAATSDPRVF